MENLGVWFMVIYGTLFGTRYIYQIKKKEISPTPSSWIIFCVATALSLGTYLNTENYELRSGIMNIMDFTVDIAILIAIIFLGGWNMHLKPFEKWYLGGIGIIFVYSIVFRDAFNANIFTQVLMTIGYFPTIHRMIIEKRNTESFFAWGIGIVGCSMGLLLTCNDYLSLLYGIRALVCVSMVFCTMLYYSFFYKKTT